MTAENNQPEFKSGKCDACGNNSNKLIEVFGTTNVRGYIRFKFCQRCKCRSDAGYNVRVSKSNA